jgi:hypothetical protein
MPAFERHVLLAYLREDYLKQLFVWLRDANEAAIKR